ncbi:DUF5722 domain-containing protein [Phragmitibacter flavus]|nr:DUF5722 domain-containing protein [Phragmitibacter flavus]
MLLRFLLFSAFTTSLIAQDPTPFPTTDSIKGLQVQMVDDALSLGIRHAALNVSLGQMMATAADPNPTIFLHHGQQHRINTAYLQQLDAQIKPLSDHHVLVYLILLAYPTKDPVRDQLLLHPNARPDGKYTIAAFNTVTPEGRDNYSALAAFLASRYSGANPTSGRVWGYIIGNEVNSQWIWYNLGKMPVDQAAGNYHEAVRLAHDAIRPHSAHARVYLSFDHHWNASMPNISDQESYPAKTFIDHFARIARESPSGDFEWHIAHHPYPDDLGNPRTWLDKNAWPTDNSPHITFKNLGVATQYMTRPELLWNGKPRRIILSEQGIHCLATPDGEDLQAAGFAYAWEQTTRQPGIDAMIWHRHVDHAHEGGLRLGLWENKPNSIADPHRPRRIHDLFKKAGTDQWPATTQFALPLIGIPGWQDLQ